MAERLFGIIGVRRLWAKSKVAHALTYLINRKSLDWEDWCGGWDARELLAQKYKEI